MKVFNLTKFIISDCDLDLWIRTGCGHTGQGGDWVGCAWLLRSLQPPDINQHPLIPTLKTADLNLPLRGLLFDSNFTVD